MSNQVFVIDTTKKPLAPCTPSTARSLLNAGKAAVYRRYPFTIILKKEVTEPVTPCQIKIDPGSKVTGIAALKGNQVVWGAELTHRGQEIKNDLLSRRAIRRSRRNRKTRYRKARFLNRTKPKGWLAPSLQHRVLTTQTWVNRIMKFCAVDSIAMELVGFDMQKLQKPEVSGVEYQQGELQGYEVREYLLEKWSRKCTYCNAENVPLQVEHIHPRAKGGTDRVSNLCLACEPCNQKKGSQDVKDFLSGKPDLLARILKQAKQPLKDAAAVNSTRWALWRSLNESGVPVSTGTGGQIKYNRIRLGIRKAHWLDAACVGSLESIEVLTNQPLLIKAAGHGSRQMVQVDKYGFPRKGYQAKRKVQDWNTGDIVNVVSGKHSGLQGKRLKTVRFKGSFDIRIDSETVISVSRKDLKPVHRKDGYGYKFAQV